MECLCYSSAKNLENREPTKFLSIPSPGVISNKISKMMLLLIVEMVASLFVDYFPSPAIAVSVAHAQCNLMLMVTIQ
jgi:hypothetical protein